MNLRRVTKPLAAAVLAVGLLTAGVVAPASAAVTPPSHSTNDTGWD